MASDQEMLDRIAKLSSAIEQQKISIRGGYTSRGGPSHRARGSYRPPFRPSPYARPPAPVSQNRTLVLNPSSATSSHTTPTYRPSSATYRRPPTTYRPPPAAYGPPPTTYRPTAPAAGLTLPASSQHRKLIINHKGNSTSSNTMIKSVDAATGRKQVAIDGVDFVVKGKKLIRKDLFDSNTTKSNFMAATNAPKVLVRKSLKGTKRRDANKNMVVGTVPVRPLKRKKIATPRTKGGNMVFTRGPEGYVRQGRSGKSLVLNTQAAKKKLRYCGFFTRYGKCPKAGHCTFQHDIHHRAICPRFLQHRCKKGDHCKLSHIPTPNIMPHCVHFQKGLCKNDPCMYIHVRVSADAPVCRAFAMEGFCSKGLDCQEKHIHVCPEFAETGKCSNANCRLPHVAKRTVTKNATTDKTTGIIRLGSWVSPAYFHAQKVAKAEKRKAIEEANASKVWTRPTEEPSKEERREKEEKDGYIKLFDDSDEDDGWSQFERESTEDTTLLRFNEEEEEEEEEDAEDEKDENSEEEEGEEEDSDDSSDDDSETEQVYEILSSDEAMSDKE